MARPDWLAYWFAALMISISVYCIGRLALARHLGRRNQTDVTVAHVLMGFAMVGMLVPRWNVVPVGLFELVFAVLAVYFLVGATRFLTARAAVATGDRQRHVTHMLIHMVMACAMLYMYWLGMPIAATASGAAMMGPPSGAGDPALTLLLVAVLAVSAIWQLDTLSRFRREPQLALAAVGGTPPPEPPSPPPGDGSPPSVAAVPWLAPRLEIGCHVVMAITMAYMLVLMT